jgi:hypothetical protein
VARSLEGIAIRTAARLNRRTFLGRMLGVASAAVAGTSMSVVLPAKRAYAWDCGASICTCGMTDSNSCWYTCGHCQCNGKMAKMCDCCSGCGNPNHFCGDPCSGICSTKRTCTTLLC